MKLEILRTDGNHPDFKTLTQELDQYLAVINGDDNSFFQSFNSISVLKNVVILYVQNRAVACGAFKPLKNYRAEIKRMFVSPEFRKQGCAEKVLTELQAWSQELGFEGAVLETSKQMIPALNFYTKMGYQHIPNYDQYVGVEASICLEKIFKKSDYSR